MTGVFRNGRRPRGRRLSACWRAAVGRLLALSGAVLLAACGMAEQEEPRASTAGGVVDSTFPIEEEIRRFVATVDSLPSRLREGAASREALVHRFVQAVETLDTLELVRLLLQRDEFIALYYPHTRFTSPPYELAPGLLWFQMQNVSSRGIGRLLARDGGRPLGVLGVECGPEPVVEERNRLWPACQVLVRDPAGVARRRTLFGTMLERDGVWKFLGYNNEY